MHRILLASILVFLSLTSFNHGRAVSNTPDPVRPFQAGATSGSTSPRRVILMIGDGMGAGQREAGRLSKAGAAGQLAMDSLAVSGWIQTADVDGGVTDSAAAATAMATGAKTHSHSVGVGPAGEVLNTILELAQANGLSTGLVVTSTLSDATPAGFAAHTDDRNDWLTISTQMMAHQVDVLMGGGEGDWLPDSELSCNEAKPGRRTDALNLITTSGAEFICTKAEFDSLATGYHHLLGFFGYSLMTRPYTPTLAEMTATALDILTTDPDGFFLMVEGSQIDKAAHTLDGANMVGDVVTFDDAVQVAKDYVSAHTDTLLIVVADHETGGVVIKMSETCDSTNEGPFAILDGGTFCTDFTSTGGGHTGADVPLTAQGPGSEWLAGTHPNTAIFSAMFRQLISNGSLFLPLLARP